MKKIAAFLIVLGIMIAPAVMAQSGKLGKVFDDYKNSKGYKSINLNASIEITDEGSDVVEQLKNLKIISLDENDVSKTEVEKFYKKSMDAIKKDGYEEMFSVREEDETVLFYIKKDKDNKISGTTLLLKEEDEVALIFIEGNLDFTRAMNLIGSNIEFGDEKDCDHSTTMTMTTTMINRQH